MPRWLFWTLLTLVSWGLWAVLLKLIGGGLSEIHVQAISTVGLLPILAALAATKDSPNSGNRLRGILLAFGSGLFSCLGNIAFFVALSRGKAATVIPLTALAPVVTIGLAIPLLKERFNRVQFAGICLSLVAILLFNIQQKSTTSSSGPAANWLFMALVAVVLWGITGLLQKMSTNHISARLSAIWFFAVFFPVAGVILLYEPLPGGLTLSIWAVAAAIGFTLALGNLTILLAFSSGGEASIITPLAGLYPIVSLPIAILWLHEKVGSREQFAIALALLAVVMLSYQSPADDATPADRSSPTNSPPASV
jgi:transporter family protein